MPAAGIIGGLLAALFGLIDWLAISAGTRAKRVGLWHGAGNVVVVALLPSAGYCAAARPTTSRRALPSGWGWSRCCWRLGPPGPVGNWWSGWGRGSTPAPIWTRPAPCPAPPPPGHSGPSSPKRSKDAFLVGSEERDQPPATTTRGAFDRRAAEDDRRRGRPGHPLHPQGEHETEGKAALRVDQEDIERIITGWPGPQQNVARQLLDKYGPPNEATPTRLFWHRNHPWKRTELTSDVVVHHCRPPHRLPHPVHRLPGAA
jgi:hypothetical protein